MRQDPLGELLQATDEAAARRVRHPELLDESTDAWIDELIVEARRRGFEPAMRMLVDTRTLLRRRAPGRTRPLRSCPKTIAPARPWAQRRAADPATVGGPGWALDTSAPGQRPIDMLPHLVWVS